MRKSRFQQLIGSIAWRVGARLDGHWRVNKWLVLTGKSSQRAKETSGMPVACMALLFNPNPDLS